MEANQPPIQSIDLQPFCDDDPHGRHSLTSPWVLGGKRIATDGKVLVCIPAPGEPDYDRNERGRMPNVADILKPIDSSRDGDWLPWPNVARCDACSGTNKVNCDRCGGDGICERCPCGASHDCGRCSDGMVNCKECLEIGSLDYRFGQALLSRRYAYLVAQLPRVEYLPTTEPGQSIVRFRFTGGEGAVASLREDS